MVVPSRALYSGWQTMTIELHWVSGSPYAWRVQLAFEIKGLTYQSQLHQISTGELKESEYLALNPRGKVPTLIDDGFVLYESLAILTYLERKFPEPPLFGQSPQETGLIWRTIAEYTAYMDDSVEGFTVPIYFGKAAEKADSIRRAAGRLHTELDHYDRQLRNSEYLVGSGVTAADIVFLPAVKSIERAAGKPSATAMNLQLLPLSDRWPAIVRWLQAIERLPGYERTVPPHWR